MLHWLEIGGLSALLSTVGGVRVPHLPHCEMDRESVVWCEFIAVVVGMSDVVVILVVILLFCAKGGGNAWACVFSCGQERAPSRHRWGKASQIYLTACRVPTR